MFCERCGTKLDRVAARGARFCASCATFVGGECWVEGAACRTCVDSGRGHAAVGLMAVRRAGRQMAATRAEVDGLEAIARISTGQPPQIDLETWFARQRARLVRDAARRAAAETAPRYTARLRPLEEEIMASFVDIGSRLDALEAGHPHEERRARSAVITPSQRRLLLVLGVALLAAVLVPRLVDRWAVPGGSGVGIAAVTASPEAGVAATRGTPAELPRSDPPAEESLTFITFDRLRMGTEIGGELSLEHGSPDQVSVSPRPSAVDRSLALVSDAAGVGAQVCIDTSFEVGTAELEMLVSDERASVLLSFGDPTTPDARLVLGGGEIELNGAVAPAAVDAQHWYRAILERDRSAATAGASVRDADGSGRPASVAVSLPAAEAGAAPGLCIGLADGVAGVELLINNVEVRQ